VEFALVAIPLCYLVVGIINYGVMLSFRQGLSQGAAEGARAAAVTVTGGDPVANAVGAVSDGLGHGLVCAPPYVVRGSAHVGSCTVHVATCSNAATQQCVTVAVSVSYKAANVSPSMPLIPMPHTLSYTAVAEVDQ
jgi:Flp pilus assembly protein TadG